MGGGDAVEEFQAIAKVNEIWIRVGDPSTAGRDRFQRDEAVGLSYSAERLKKDSVDPCECGGADADANRQVENGDDGEGLIAQEHAKAEADVLHEGFQEGEGASLAICLAGLLCAA
jgi:hypothetical protein